MFSGVFGYSGLFELFVVYVISVLAFEKTEQKWTAIALGVLVLVIIQTFSAENFASILQGNWDFVWQWVDKTFLH